MTGQNEEKKEELIVKLKKDPVVKYWEFFNDNKHNYVKFNFFHFRTILPKNIVDIIFKKLRFKDNDNVTWDKYVEAVWFSDDRNRRKFVLEEIKKDPLVTMVLKNILPIIFSNEKLYKYRFTKYYLNFLRFWPKMVSIFIKTYILQKNTKNQF